MVLYYLVGGVISALVGPVLTQVFWPIDESHSAIDDPNICLTGTRELNCVRQPVRTIKVVFAGSVACIWLPQFPQNPCNRSLPLSAVFKYSLTLPVISMFSAGIKATARNGAPLNFWQSVQWQAITIAEATVPLILISPQ